MLRNSPIVALTCLLALAIAVLSIKRFHVLAMARRLSDYPKDARSWTTFYNFIFSTTLYVSLAIVVFATLDNLPDLTVALVSVFSIEGSKSLEALIKRLMDESTREWVTPILAALALVALFGFEKSPLAIVDRWIREILQRWASIPSKVRNTIAQLETADFDLPAGRRTRVLSHIAECAGDDPSTDFSSDLEDVEMSTLVMRSGSLDLAFSEWKGSESAFNDLYRDNEELMKKLSDEFATIAKLVGYYLALVRSSDSDTAEAKIDRGKRSTEIIERLTALLVRQYLPFACGILQSSRRASERAKFLAAFGFRIIKPIQASAVFEYMLEDLAQMVFLLVVTIYPVVYFSARYTGWKPDNGYLDTVLIWPCQLGVFALASVLPALLWRHWLEQAGAEPHTTGRRRGHYLAYLSIAVTGAISAILAVAVLSLISLSIVALPQMIGTHAIEAAFLKVIPFGLVAASIGAVTAILIDIPLHFRFRSVSDGLATGIIAATVAMIAVVAQTNADVDSYWKLLMLDPETMARYPGLRVLQFVLPIDFAMGFCIGAIIPNGYRQYCRELVSGPAVT